MWFSNARLCNENRFVSSILLHRDCFFSHLSAYMSSMNTVYSVTSPKSITRLVKSFRQLRVQLCGSGNGWLPMRHVVVPAFSPICDFRTEHHVQTSPCVERCPRSAKQSEKLLLFGDAQSVSVRTLRRGTSSSPESTCESSLPHSISALGKPGEMMRRCVPSCWFSLHTVNCWGSLSFVGVCCHLLLPHCRTQTSGWLSLGHVIVSAGRQETFRRLN